MILVIKFKGLLTLFPFLFTIQSVDISVISLPVLDSNFQLNYSLWSIVWCFEDFKAIFDTHFDTVTTFYYQYFVASFLFYGRLINEIRNTHSIVSHVKIMSAEELYSCWRLDAHNTCPLSHCPDPSPTAFLLPRELLLLPLVGGDDELITLGVCVCVAVSRSHVFSVRVPRRNAL